LTCGYEFLQFYFLFCDIAVNGFESVIWYICLILKLLIFLEVVFGLLLIFGVLRFYFPGTHNIL